MEFFGSVWRSRGFQPLATFFDPYRGRGWDEFGDDNLQRGFAVGDFDGGAVVSYEYRADGMRTRKLAVGTGQHEILYLHDGQNPVEEATFSNGPTRGAYTEIVRNGLGARGIDYVEVFKTGSATSVRFPVYDAHGNMTACLLRDGAGGFTLTSRRAYDPWGAMRQWGTHR